MHVDYIQPASSRSDAFNEVLCVSTCMREKAHTAQNSSMPCHKARQLTNTFRVCPWAQVGAEISEISYARPCVFQLRLTLCHSFCPDLWGITAVWACAEVAKQEGIRGGRGSYTTHIVSVFYIQAKTQGDLWPFDWILPLCMSSFAVTERSKWRRMWFWFLVEVKLDKSNWIVTCIPSTCFESEPNSVFSATTG